MRKLLLFLVALLFLASSVSAQTSDCTIHNSAWTAPILPGSNSYSDYQSDTTQHNPGSNHFGASIVHGTCKYTGANKSGYCSVACSSVTYAVKGDGQNLSVYGSHDAEVATLQGGSSFDGGLGEQTPPTATCGGQAEYAAQYCYATLSGICGLSISLSGGVAGLGASVSINDATVWKTGYTFPHTCGSYFSPGCIPPTLDNYPPPQGPDGMWKWNSNTCTLYWDNFGSHTPIIIDTDGSGFQLTSVANGVKFDFLGTGNPIQIAWTAPGSTNGWLAIDLNGNGTIDSAKELFSNIAAQPTNPSDTNAPDGFNDLSQYDSNHDGVIDKNDPVWPKLLVWIDSNHDGISQPGELHHLDDVGIHSISTKYSVSPQTDQFGNQFHLKGHLNPDKGDNVDRVIYDVYLATGQPAAQNQQTAKK